MLLTCCLFPGLSYGQWTNIPDLAFEQLLIDEGYDEAPADGRVLTAEIDYIDNLIIENSAVSDLTGIEDFTSLIDLVCANTSLTSINLPNRNLRTLIVEDNALLTSIIVAGKSAFTGAIISRNPSLTDLNLSFNELTTCALSFNPAIRFLDLTDNNLPFLNTIGLPNLEVLRVAGNALVSLSLTESPSLIDLRCEENNLTSLDLSRNTALQLLFCQNNFLATLDLRNNTALNWLDCSDNRLTRLDMRNGNNINFNFLFGVYFFFAGNNLLECISVDDPVWATANFTIIDPGTIFDGGSCSFTAIPDLNFEQKLISLGIDEGIPDGEVSTDAIENLTSLDVSASNISDLTGIEDFASLQVLYCYENVLEVLNLRQNTALTTLICSDNELTGLDLSQNTALAILNCRTNSMTSLDLRPNEALSQLVCDNNRLTGLDLSQNPALTVLVCNDNDLATLNVRNGNNLNFALFFGDYFFLAGNNPLECIVVDDPAWSTENLLNRDAGTYFSSDCRCPSPSWTVAGANATAVTADASCVAADGWTHYLNSAAEEVLLSLQLGTSGAVIPPTAVTIDPDGGTNMFWAPPAAGNFVDNSAGAVFMRRKWEVVPGTQPASPVGVRFYYTTEEYDAVNNEVIRRGDPPLTEHAKMRFFKVGSGVDPFEVATLPSTDVIDLAPGSASTTSWSYNTFGTDHYSEFRVNSFSGGGGGVFLETVLPVELLYLRGEALKSGNRISWSTATEAGTEVHIIERLIAGSTEWLPIGEMEAAGFSTEITTYSFIDDTPPDLVYYRLRTHDFDGSEQLSESISVERKTNTFEVISVYPTPAKAEIFVKFSLPTQGEVSFLLFDYAGKKLRSGSFTSSEGINQLQIDLSGLGAGLYLLQLDNGDEQLLQRLVK